MASGHFTGTLNFGAAPGSNEASVVVTSGMASISTTSKVEAYFMADDTSGSHTAADHRYAPLFISLTCGTPVAATSVTVYGRSTEKMEGTYAFRGIWAD
jgi:hypothetical protein